jgi:hypothetical protein
MGNIIRPILNFKKSKNVGMVTRAYNPSTQRAEAERSQVQGQPEQFSKTLSQKKKKKKK